MAQPLTLPNAIAQQMRLAGASQKMINKVRRGLKTPKAAVKIDKKLLRRAENVLTANGVVVLTAKRAFTLSGYLKQMKHGHTFGAAALVGARGVQATKRAALKVGHTAKSDDIGAAKGTTPGDAQAKMAHVAH